MEHEDICIPFEIKGRHFEAVGFLKADEPKFTVYHASLRCGMERVVRYKSEDWELILGAREAIPEELFGFTLVCAPQDEEEPGPRECGELVSQEWGGWGANNAIPLSIWPKAIFERPMKWGFASHIKALTRSYLLLRRADVVDDLSE